VRVVEEERREERGEGGRKITSRPSEREVHNLTPLTFVDGDILYNSY
jgi:hypothetical protein